MYKWSHCMTAALFPASKSHQTFHEKLLSISLDLDFCVSSCMFCKLILKKITQLSFQEETQSPTKILVYILFTKNTLNSIQKFTLFVLLHALFS